jgi:archaetidylinositol phosphate synthase
MSTRAAAVGEGSKFAAAQRLNRSLTASAEKRLLVWMAQRAPRWVTSDRLTLLGFGAQIGAGACYAIARYDRRALLLACLCVGLNWLGDSLDGTLARVRSRERPRYGFYVDHMVDIFGSAALMGGLAWSGLLHGAVAAALLVAFLLLAGESYLAAHTLGRFEMSQAFFGPTELRILLVAGTLRAMAHPDVRLASHRMLLFDLGGGTAAVAMAAMAVVVGIRHTAQLFRQEPLP